MARDFYYWFDHYRHRQDPLFNSPLPALKKMYSRADMNLRSENVLILSASLNMQARLFYEPKRSAKNHQIVLWTCVLPVSHIAQSFKVAN